MNDEDMLSNASSTHSQQVKDVEATIDVLPSYKETTQQQYVEQENQVEEEKIVHDIEQSINIEKVEHAEESPIEEEERQDNVEDTLLEEQVKETEQITNEIEKVETEKEKDVKNLDIEMEEDSNTNIIVEKDQEIVTISEEENDLLMHVEYVETQKTVSIDEEEIEHHIEQPIDITFESVVQQEEIGQSIDNTHVMHEEEISLPQMKAEIPIITKEQTSSGASDNEHVIESPSHQSHLTEKEYIKEQEQIDNINVEDHKGSTHTEIELEETKHEGVEADNIDIVMIPEETQPPKKEKEKISLHTKVSRSITLIGWIVSTALCIWYIIDSAEQYVLSNNKPTTATSFVDAFPLPFPAITVCNWNALVNCNYCNLTLKYSTRVNANLGTVESFDPYYDRITLFQNGQLYNCYVFNNFTQSQLNATSIGYSGTFSFHFKVPLAPEERDARFGLQVSFHESGTVPNVFAETNYAISGVDNYFILTKIITNRLKPNIEDGSLSSVRWVPQLSVVELTHVVGDEVVISVAYSTLNVYVITEMVTATMEGLLGQIAGMIGVFVGLDVLKLLRAFLEIPYAIEKQSIATLWKIIH